MQSLKIQGIKRNEISKTAVKALRNEGMVPCVLYGVSEPVHFAAKEIDFKKLIFTANTYSVELDIDGKVYKAVMKERQFHPLTDRLLHIDFLELSDKKPIAISIPVKIVGAAEGVKQGGRLVTKMRKVNIKALPSAIPDFVELNIENLNIGDSIRVKDVKINGVTLTDPGTNVIIGVRVTRKVEAVAVAEPVAGAAAAPEGEEKKEEAAS